MNAIHRSLLTSVAAPIIVSGVIGAVVMYANNASLEATMESQIGALRADVARLETTLERHEERGHRSTDRAIAAIETRLAEMSSDVRWVRQRLDEDRRADRRIRSPHDMD